MKNKNITIFMSILLAVIAVGSFYPLSSTAKEHKNFKRVDYPIFSTKYKGIHWFPLRLARFPTGERWGQQDVGHGIVATGRGV
ncbi:hypothetical protein, partial [Rummeliibacillus suwonensis]|uniref:hypothetical protein n=1 Tax=Rummeliibacillus suwonensis TaxID=1306154 RepID=UPI00289DAC6E